MLLFSLLTSTVALANAMTSSLVYRECWKLHHYTSFYINLTE
jgi:hypothetical protein